MRQTKTFNHYTNRLLAIACIFTIGLSGLIQPALADNELLLKELLAEIKGLKQRVAELEESSKTSSAVKSASPIEKSPVEKPLAKTDDDLDQMVADQPQSSDDVAAGDTAPTSITSASDKPEPGTSFIRNVVSNTTVGGYVSSEFENFEDSNSSFDQHRLVLNVASQLHKRLSFYSELEYEHGPSFGSASEGTASGSISDTNGNGVIDADEASDIVLDAETDSGKSGEIEIEQAWMQYDFNDNLGLRTGVILVPFGRFNLYHDDDLNNLTDRPLVARRVIPTTWAEAGLGLVGNSELGDTATVGGELYLVNGLDDGFSASSGGLRSARGSRESDNNNNKAVVSRVTFSPGLGHEFGTSGYYGSYDDNGDKNAAGWGVDWLMNFGDLRLIGELASFHLENGLNADGAIAPNSISGLYAEANYGFWFNGLNNTVLGDSFEDPKFILSYRFNYAEVDRRDGASTLDQDGHVVGLAYRPVQSFVLKTEYQFNDGDLERKDSDGFIGSVALGF